RLTPATSTTWSTAPAASPTTRDSPSRATGSSSPPACRSGRRAPPTCSASPTSRRSTATLVGKHHLAERLRARFRADTVPIAVCGDALLAPAGHRLQVVVRARDVFDRRHDQLPRDPVGLVAKIPDPDQLGAVNVAREPRAVDLLVDHGVAIA